MFPDGVQRDAAENKERGKQNVVEIADKRAQSNGSKEEQQNRCKATQRGNDRADDSCSE